VILGLAAARPAAAFFGKFAIDPVQSTIQIVPGSGSRLTLQVGTATNLAVPLAAPTTGTPGTLPDGSTSDGLRTSLGGNLFIDVSDTLSTLELIGRRAVVQLQTSGSWLPGPPTATATPTAGQLAIALSDAMTGLIGNVVIRQGVMSAGSGGVALPLTAGAAAGTFHFPAGCAVGACAKLRVEDAIADASSNQGFGSRLGVPRRAPVGNASGTVGTLQSLGGGQFKVTLPINVAVTLTNGDIGGGLPLSLDLALTGQIVAVPEPSAVALGAMALGTLVLVWALSGPTAGRGRG